LKADQDHLIHPLHHPIDHTEPVIYVRGRGATVHFARGDHAATVKVAGYRAPADVRRGRTRRSASGMPSIPGHYPTRVYLPTRTALRLLVTGHFGDVRAACNWTLEIAE